MSNNGKSDSGFATNRKARRDYTVLEKFEAGIELQGTEVKSVRSSHASISESHAQFDGGQLFVWGMHIQPYKYGNVHNHDPDRPKRLLLHRREIDSLQGKVATKGLTLIPLRLYAKRGKVKIELGLCRGKQQEDKRETLKKRTADREAERAMARCKR